MSDFDRAVIEHNQGRCRTCDMSVHMIDASAMIQRQIFNHDGRKARLICDRFSPVTQPSFVDNAYGVR